MKKHDTDTIINIEISDNFKEVSEEIQSSNKQLPNLEEKNIRNVPVITKYQKYAPDIHVYYDYEKIKQDLKYFKLISTKNGFTSKVNIYEYNGYKIIEKIYKNVDSNSQWYVDNNFIKESYYNELSALTILKEEDIFPKILFYDEDNMKIIMTYKGENISDKNVNINLEVIPKDWKLQLYHILRTLKKYNLYHNDITCRNLCIKDNILYLIDFGNCKKFVDLYYRNYYTDLILESDNIIDFFDIIDKNSYEIRKCQIE
jgi:tRNA A-37 threonylcarbamoyl transferase component Bud32